MGSPLKDSLKELPTSRVSRVMKIVLIGLILILLFLAFEVIPPTIDEYFISQRLLKSSHQNYESVALRNISPSNSESIKQNLEPATESNEVIKVAAFNDAFWFGRLGSQDISGYGPQFLEEIAQFTGWKYEYIPMTIPAAHEALKNGEIDLIAPRMYTPNDSLLYTNKPAGTMRMVFLVNSDSSITFRDFAAFNGRTFGCIKGTSEAGRLEQDSRLFNYIYKINFYESNEALLTALSTNEIEIAVASDICISNQEPFRLVHSFLPQPFYFVVSAERIDIARKFNEAFDKIETSTPNFSDKLTQELVFGREQLGLTFNVAELAFIEQSSKIRVGYIDNQAPLEYSPNKKDASATGAGGVLGRILDTISQKTSLTFQAISYPDSRSLEEAIANRHIDLVSNYIPKESELKTSPELVPTPRYASFPVVKLTKPENTNTSPSNIVIPYTLRWLAAELKKENPNSFIIETDTASQGFSLVASGKADALYANLLEVDYILESHNAEGKYTLSHTTYVDDLMFGVLTKSEPALLSIMSNTINSLSPVENSDITTTGTRPRPDGITGFLREYAVELALITSMFIAAIFIVLWHERKKVLARVEESAFKDQLTGLPNRNRFLAELKSLLAEGKGKGSAVVALDIKNFKSVNNLYSESFGNELLLHIAELIGNALPKESFLAHDKADIFLICFYNSSAEEITKILTENILPIEHINFKNAGALELSFVVGIYLIQEDDMTAGAVLNNADVARLEAKNSPSSSIVFFNETMRQDLVSSSILENDLKLALARDELVVHYQSKFDLNTLQTTSHEVLIRWEHPLAGIVTPSSFVPLAERLGIIKKISAVVIKKSCTDYVALRKQIEEENKNCAQKGQVPLAQFLKISINLSTSDIIERSTIDFLKKQVEFYDINPEDIQIEVTESVVLTDKTRAISRLNELKEFGFTIALDDFGTGYSSLGLINELPIDTIKIDKKFVQSIEVDEKARQVLRSIVHLINELGIESVAEGIETEYQLEFLRETGCKGGQGFYYSFPIPRDLVIQEYYERRNISPKVSQDS